VSSDSQDLAKKRATYLTLMGGMAGLFGAITSTGGAKGRQLAFSALDVGLLGLATYRAGRVIALDQVTEPLRAPFTKTTGDGTEPRGTGAQRAIGELVSCPTCIATWIGAGLVYGLRVAPAPTRAFLAIMSASGIAELLDYATNALDGSRQAALARAELASAEAERAKGGPRPTPLVAADEGLLDD
jgi:hypothetical protein